MTAGELIEILKAFDSDMEIEFEFEEYSADGGTWVLEPDTIIKLDYDKDAKETILFNFSSIGSY